MSVACGVAAAPWRSARIWSNSVLSLPMRAPILPMRRARPVSVAPAADVAASFSMSMVSMGANAKNSCLSLSPRRSYSSSSLMSDRCVFWLTR